MNASEMKNIQKIGSWIENRGEQDFLVADLQVEIDRMDAFIAEHGEDVPLGEAG